MNPSQAAIHVIVEGRVQGVGFRYFVAEHAEALELTGWVRNRERGEVEVLAEGARASLDQLVTWLERGPSSAFVSNITVEWVEATGKYLQFSIASTEW